MTPVGCSATPGRLLDEDQLNELSSTQMLSHTVKKKKKKKKPVRIQIVPGKLLFVLIIIRDKIRKS